jgi:hypothetical protein
MAQVINANRLIRQPWSYAEPSGLEFTQTGPLTGNITAGTVHFWNIDTQSHKTFNVDPQTYNFPVELIGAGAGRVYLYLQNNNGVCDLITDAAAPSLATLNNRVCIGIATTLDGATFNNITPFIVDASPLTLSLLSGRFPVKVLNGLGLSIPAVPTTRRLNRAAGNLTAPGRNWFTDATSYLNPHVVSFAANTPIVFSLLSDATNVTNGTNELITNLSDNGNGTTTTRNSGAGISRLFYSVNSATLVQLLPQTWYNSVDTAEENIFTENWVRPELFDGFVYAGALVLRYNVTIANMNDPAFVRLREV